MLLSSDESAVMLPHDWENVNRAPHPSLMGIAVRLLIVAKG